MPQQPWWRCGLVWVRRWLCFVILAAFPPGTLVQKCEDPTIEHGRIISGFMSSYTDGDIVTFECKIGYFMVGSYFIRCENNSWHPTIPSCQKIAKDLCGAPILSNGMVEPLKNQYQAGSIIAVHCIPKYCFPDETIESTAKCNGFNIWEPPVQPCFLRTSRDTSKFFLHNGEIVSGEKKFYEPGDKITVQCYPGFALNGPSEIRYVGGGKWLPVHPRCYLRNGNQNISSIKNSIQYNIL
nr:PREDICTED: complement component receptor 1-like protein isoform X2 [Anolis carolinensis]|eukprot:XP_016847144.1 PREDICTED: complement component receptor 1-like protein isoform X2 [Anolis carolinensis]